MGNSDSQIVQMYEGGGVFGGGGAARSGNVPLPNGGGRAPLNWDDLAPLPEYGDVIGVGIVEVVGGGFTFS